MDSRDHADDDDDEEYDEEAMSAKIFTALYAAARAGDEGGVMDSLSSLGVISFDYTLDSEPSFETISEGKNILVLCCELANIELVRVLLDAGASTTQYTLGSKMFNTYKPLFFASLSAAEKTAREDVKHLVDRPPPGATQQRLTFGGRGGGVGLAAPPPPPTAAADAARREEIVRLLVEKGAGTELDPAKRPQDVDGCHGWEAWDGCIPPFSAQQAALIARALSRA